MAMNKPFPTDVGILATYWKIAFVIVNLIDNNIRLKIHGFASQQAREDGAQPLQILDAVIDGEEFHQDMTIAQMYDFLTHNPGQFEGAVNTDA
ncbi:MAG: hypothetical protein JWO78_223 [Micavibrio sp.]|nr:hypothetical protein [Micavibrio sp.]